MVPSLLGCIDDLSLKFRWVACQIEFLCELPNDAARRTALQSLPPDLHSTYSRILDRVDQANDISAPLS